MLVTVPTLVVEARTGEREDELRDRGAHPRQALKVCADLSLKCLFR